MKKFLLLTIALVSLFACSSDDDNNVQDEQNKIIGTWRLAANIVDGEAEELDSCDLQTTFKFEQENNVFYATIYYSNTSGSCTYEASMGSWEWIGDNTIKVSAGTETLDFEVSYEYGNLNLTFNDGTEEEPFYVLQSFIKVN
ncbi:lipocalin family protein [Flavobacterium rakeshii]|uniref:lipocalin family protein n=1 Tax=Flavobacterium rakeshii TaxID=1038845 RepID=UPI002E7AF5AC|nr:lipocalin family protein [Flavobacterium rakeshii]MEE1897113.1 lipocalin family protein [Flavobacterium rakeshii]